jgi:hypothetical protein
MRIALPLIGACICLGVASRITVPLLGFGLFVVAMGLVLDAATKLFARATSSGGMHDYHQ